MSLFDTAAVLDSQWLLSDSAATVTVVGVVIDHNGTVAKTVNGTTAPSFTGTIPAQGSDPVRWRTVLGLTGSVADNYPAARGLVVSLTGNIRVWPEDSATYPADFKTNPTRAKRVIAYAQGNIIGLGDIGINAQPGLTPINYYSNFGGAANAQVSTKPGAITKVRGLNSTSTLYYLQVHDSATTPAGGTVPLLSIPVGIGVATSPTSEERPANDVSIPIVRGIFVGWSSTQGTYTAATPSAQSFEVEF